GKTALHCAVKSGHSGVGRVLLDLGKADVTSVDNKKRTPLHHAAGNGHSDSVEMLLRHNAPMEARDIHGSTPLLYAANSGHESTVTILVNESADINA
ncbi:ankyrin, partial [Morchella conica CCBAS932]